MNTSLIHPLILLFYLIYSIDGYAYTAKAYHPNIRTIQLLQNGQWGTLPCIQIDSNEYLSLSFDILDASPERLRYKITHRDIYGEPSPIHFNEYITGFNDNLIEEYALSEGTLVDYTHYRLQLPNEDCQFKLTGNYTVDIYHEDRPDEVLLTAHFYVVDHKVTIDADISTNTSQGQNIGLQQVNMSILYPLNLQIYNPTDEIKVFTLQNRQATTIRGPLAPSFEQPGKLIFKQHPQLLFPAGNEYRRFDFSNLPSEGMHVDNISINNNQYEVTLRQDVAHTNTSYVYDEDQNGQFIIHKTGSRHPSTEADYAWVNFSLKPSQTTPPTPIHLAGDFINSTPPEEMQMRYNSTNKCFETSILLKQGLYNYRYLTHDSTQRTTIDGNHHETENEYLIMVYYRPTGGRFFSLIGISSVKYENGSTTLIK